MLTRHDLRAVEGDYGQVLPRPVVAGDEPLDAVRSIIAAVRERGDDAIVEFGERFDGAAPVNLRVPPDEIAAAVESVDPEVVAALRAAADSIEAFYRSGPDGTHTHVRNGLTVEARRQPVDRAGIYAPGGRAAYPSTVLMTAVLAQVAGVAQIALCVPPGADGRVAPVTLAAASIAGVHEVYATGGAQAIAAMAYGTDTIAAVDVIAGPGNVYVALAKQEVAGAVGVASSFAGPSEIVVVADHTAPPRYAAIDLIVQAEHGPDGLSWLITWDDAVADAVEHAVGDLVAEAPRRDDILATLADGGHIAMVRDAQQAVEVANAIAPEHLQLMVAEPQALVPLVRHAGAVFLGPMAPASLGDYIAGPSHVLPTNGTARFASALSVEDFCKHVHVVSVTDDGFAAVAPHVAALATAEGLDAHAQSVLLRTAADSPT